MTKEKLNVAGWMSITNAVISIPILGLTIFLEGASSGGAILLQLLLALVNIGLFVYIVSSFKELLNDYFDFHATDTLIQMQIWISIASSILTLLMLLIPSLKTVVGIISIVLMICYGIISIVFSIKLLKLQDNLSGLLKPFVYTSIATGFCFATIILIPLAVLTNAAVDIMLGIIFMKASERQHPEKR